MTDLKPCPFCGGTNIELRDNGIGDSYAICYSDDPSEVACGARTDDANCETDESANSRWNKRASPPGGEWQGIDTVSQSQPSGEASADAEVFAGLGAEGSAAFRAAWEDYTRNPRTKNASEQVCYHFFCCGQQATMLSPVWRCPDCGTETSHAPGCRAGPEDIWVNVPTTVMPGGDR